MFLKAKTLAFSGVLLALCVICVILSGVLEINTLALLALGAFFVGISIREWGWKAGAAFYVAAVLLSLLLAPNKLYCVTFGAMGLYILLVELVFALLAKQKKIARRKLCFWICKLVVFNAMFLPMAIGFPQLLEMGVLSGWALAGVLAAGQVIWLLFDFAYEYFQRTVWTKLRSRLPLR